LQGLRRKIFENRPSDRADGLHLVTSSCRLMASIEAGVAGYESEVRAERILAGQTAARMHGTH
jgi:hypothetical protein